MSNDIPAGRYVGRAVGCAQFGGRTGSEQMGVRFELLNEGFERRTVIWYQNIAASNPTGMEIAVRGLRDAGWAGDDIAEANESTGLGSVDVDLAISYREWDGKQKMDVRVFGIGGGAMFKEENALDERAMSALTARMKGLALKFKPHGKATGGSPPPSFLSRPSQPAPRSNDTGWDGTGAAPYDDADFDGRDSRNGAHIEHPRQDDGTIPGA